MLAVQDQLNKWWHSSFFSYEVYIIIVQSCNTNYYYNVIIYGFTHTDVILTSTYGVHITKVDKCSSLEFRFIA